MKLDPYLKGMKDLKDIKVDNCWNKTQCKSLITLDSTLIAWILNHKFATRKTTLKKEIEEDYRRWRDLPCS
jgi:hypothetical protein